MTRLAALLVLSLSLGCREDTAPPAFVVGDVCASSASYCDTWEAVVRCVDGRWVSTECTEACGGAAKGCLLRRSSYVSRAACLCGDDSLAPKAEEESSTSGFDECVDPETLIECDAQECAEYECADLCSQRADFPTSLGCRDGACECSAIGAPCEGDELARCEPAASIVACVGGVWTSTDCRVQCGSPAASCGYGPTQEAVCGCGE